MTVQSTIAIVTDLGRQALAQYMAGAGTFNINYYAIGKGGVGVPPSPGQTAQSNRIDISGSEMTLITDNGGSKSFIVPSLASFQIVLPVAFAPADPISELGIYSSPNSTESNGVLFAYATFAPIVKTNGNSLTFSFKIQA